MGQTIAGTIGEEGRLKGPSERELRAARHILRLLLTDRFGTLPETVVQRIECCTDPERFLAAVEQVQTIEELDDLQL